MVHYYRVQTTGQVFCSTGPSLNRACPSRDAQEPHDSIRDDRCPPVLSHLGMTSTAQAVDLGADI